MKIKPEHAAQVSKLIEVLVAENAREIEKHAAKVSPKRLRWDVFNLAVPYDPLIKKIYEYANDDHIDTLLRQIFKHKA